MDGSYDLGVDVVAPGVPGRAVLRPSVDSAIEAAAADLFLQASACVRAFGQFHLAMGYGPAEHRLIVRLMTDPNYRDLPWSRTHLWSVGEARVPPGDERHSHTHLVELVAGACDLPEGQMYPLAAHLPDADERYEATLRDELGRREPGHDRLDCVLLPAEAGWLRGLNDPLDRLVGVSEDGGRVAMTARMLRGSRLLMVLALGEPAEHAVRAAAADHGAVGIVPDGGELRWYLDHRACGIENTEGPE